MIKKMKAELLKPVRYLPGVGPKRAFLFKKLGVETVEDLLYFAPRKYLDRREIKEMRYLRNGEEATVLGKVLTKGTKLTGTKKIFILIITDETDWMELTWFHLPQLEKLFKIGDKIIASGKVKIFRGVKQMIHPEYEIVDDKKKEILSAGRIIPVYPSTEGLKPRFVRKLVYETLQRYENKITDTLPQEIRRRRGILQRKEAIRKLHFPEELKDAKKARESLVYEELFYFFLNLSKRKKTERKKSFPLLARNDLTKKLLSTLSFELTRAQKRVIAEIEEDLSKERQMHRLLQGDVGSGKTIVALYAILRAVENGYQAALMVPTEVLAEQHSIVLSYYLEKIGCKLALLTGGMKKKEKERILYEILKGETQVIIGTHALIQEGVIFNNLALAVVDEQHRFGVLQRMKLIEKGNEEKAPHLLVMTATPIPRTLALTLYGDLDVSIIDEKPPGRGKIVTRWVKEDKRKVVYSWLFDFVRRGNRAYVIAPLIEKSEKLEVEAACELYEKLRKVAPKEIKVSLIHGKMKREERKFLMEAFRRGDFQILVSTTVIEVGIDIPDATCMVIEHAERFGLSQLHQLRGRVGRGKKTSFCILLTPKKVTEEASKRLGALVETSDGFKIAEVDLILRGPGEFFGTRQHGMPDFRIADIIKDNYILGIAKSDAERIIEEDPHLERESNLVLRENLKRVGKKEVFYAG